MKNKVSKAALIRFFEMHGWTQNGSTNEYVIFERTDLMESSNSWWISAEGRVREGISFNKSRDITKTVHQAILRKESR